MSTPDTDAAVDEDGVPPSERPKMPTIGGWNALSVEQQLKLMLEVLVDAAEHDHNRSQHSNLLRRMTSVARSVLDVHERRAEGERT